MQKSKLIQKELLIWYNPKDRILPWKGISNPYHIWVSEIILQQTRAQQAIPYYLNFIAEFPTVKDLASAHLDQVLKAWEGLGYYSRARNLHFAANQIVDNHNGEVPNSYSEILKLKGIGTYTAAAVSSFAYGLPYPVLDGNVYRLLARLFNINLPTNVASSKPTFQKSLVSIFSADRPALFNQAIMDFGATICKPKLPLCNTCILQTYCAAHKLSIVDKLPLKKKSIKKRVRSFHFVLFKYKNKVLIQQRMKKDIWKGLYQFPLVELEIDADKSKILSTLGLKKTKNFKLSKICDSSQVLSHQKINARFWKCTGPLETQNLSEDSIWVDKRELTNFAFPKLFGLFFKHI